MKKGKHYKGEVGNEHIRHLRREKRLPLSCPALSWGRGSHPLIVQGEKPPVHYKLSLVLDSEVTQGLL